MGTFGMFHVWKHGIHSLTHMHVGIVYCWFTCLWRSNPKDRGEERRDCHQCQNRTTRQHSASDRDTKSDRQEAWWRRKTETRCHFTCIKDCATQHTDKAYLDLYTHVNIQSVASFYCDSLYIKCQRYSHLYKSLLRDIFLSIVQSAIIKLRVKLLSLIVYASSVIIHLPAFSVVDCMKNRAEDWWWHKATSFVLYVRFSGNKPTQLWILVMETPIW